MPARQSRHRLHFRWYNPLPRELWDSRLCNCGVGARWWKEARHPLSSVYLDIEFPTDPEDAPSLLCDDCYRSHCGGVTNSERREYDVDRHGTPVFNGDSYSNHIKRRLP